MPKGKMKYLCHDITIRLDQSQFLTNSQDSLLCRRSLGLCMYELDNNCCDVINHPFLLHQPPLICLIYQLRPNKACSATNSSINVTMLLLTMLLEKQNGFCITETSLQQGMHKATKPHKNRHLSDASQCEAGKGMLLHSHQDTQHALPK